LGRLSTHVLDVSSGRPAGHVRVSLYALGSVRTLINRAITNADGRCDAPLAEGATLKSGSYELEFEIGEYYRGIGQPASDPPFLGTVIVRFGVADPVQNYHVPLLVTPWSYSTYRGS
jgi:5-hydroxyisourate hydrolase